VNAPSATRSRRGKYAVEFSSAADSLRKQLVSSSWAREVSVLQEFEQKRRLWERGLERNIDRWAGERAPSADGAKEHCVAGSPQPA
jgi:hypothetical protein